MGSALAEYPMVERVRATKVGGERRQRVLEALAAFEDEGAEPSLREIAERARVNSWSKAKRLIRALEAEGFVAVEWVKPVDVKRARREGRRCPRNRYRVLA